MSINDVHGKAMINSWVDSDGQGDKAIFILPSLTLHSKALSQREESFPDHLNTKNEDGVEMAIK